MTNQSKEPPQPETQTKEMPARPEWIAPTLAGLQRLSVAPPSSSKPS
jgi:hypothetical protein